mmetsp:Transcript_97443/g.275694  ORF Transcript_97443/g.275694 Transcript_97443/m.275694 type:complete len:252 (-) Transcript_97443:170-925(-)
MPPQPYVIAENHGDDSVPSRRKYQHHGGRHVLEVEPIKTTACDVHPTEEADEDTDTYAHEEQILRTALRLDVTDAQPDGAQPCGQDDDEHRDLAEHGVELAVGVNASVHSHPHGAKLNADRGQHHTGEPHVHLQDGRDPDVCAVRVLLVHRVRHVGLPSRRVPPAPVQDRLEDRVHEDAEAGGRIGNGDVQILPLESVHVVVPVWVQLISPLDVWRLRRHCFADEAPLDAQRLISAGPCVEHHVRWAASRH